MSCGWFGISGGCLFLASLVLVLVVAVRSAVELKGDVDSRDQLVDGPHLSPP